MGDPCSSDTWKKLVVAKTNDQWVSITKIKKEITNDVHIIEQNFSLDYRQTPYCSVKTEELEGTSGKVWPIDWPPCTSDSEEDPLLIKRKVKGESSDERALRLAKMSAYAAQRLANETPDQRASRLKRMSQYAAKRLATETIEQRKKRLARMSAYAAKRLAQETPEQREARLARMSAYAARRHAMKKKIIAATESLQSNTNSKDNSTFMQHKALP